MRINLPARVQPMGWGVLAGGRPAQRRPKAGVACLRADVIFSSSCASARRKGLSPFSGNRGRRLPIRASPDVSARWSFCGISPRDISTGLPSCWGITRPVLVSRSARGVDAMQTFASVEALGTAPIMGLECLCISQLFPSHRASCPFVRPARPAAHVRESRPMPSVCGGEGQGRGSRLRETALVSGVLQ